MPRKAKQTETLEADEMIRYEVGYHLVPLIAEEGLPAEVGNVREIIEQAGGVSTSDQFPTNRPLAYPMSRMVGGKRETFTQSYFGWMQFELTPSSVEGVKHALENNKNVLRLIFLRAKRETPVSARTPLIQPAEGSTEEGGNALPEIDTPAQPTMLSEEELDRTIEELVIE
jgi:ribosomal protein S6